MGDAVDGLAEALAVDGLAEALRRTLDVSARVEPRTGAPRHCTNSNCACAHTVVLHGHTISLGHASLAVDEVDYTKICTRVASTPCSCCKAERRAARRQRRFDDDSHEWPTDSSCPSPVIDNNNGDAAEQAARRARRLESKVKEVRHCHYCGSTRHLMRACTMGSSTHRSHQFLQCSDACFVRRFVVPLHHARTDFALDDLRTGRVDLAARLITASLVCSQRLRHNSEVWMPFLGGDDPAVHPTTVCVTGGLVRGLHPSELSTATRLRQAFDALGEGGPDAGTPTPNLHPDLRGFRILPGGLAEALTEALTLARADGTRAPMLLLAQGAPPLMRVLDAAVASEGVAGGVDVSPSPPAGAGGSGLRDMVIVLGDHIGLSTEEEDLVSALGASVAGGGPVWRASLAQGALLASQCIVIVNHYLDAIHDCPSRLWVESFDFKKTKRQRQKRVRRAQKKLSAPGAEAASSEDPTSASSDEDHGKDEHA